MNAAVLIAPLLLLVSTIAYAANGDGLNDGEVGGMIQVFSMIAFAIAAFVLTNRIRESSWARAADVALALALAGAAGGVGFGIDSIHVAVFGTESLQEADSAAGMLALRIPGLLFPIGLIAIGVLLARSGTAPTAAAYGLVVGAVLFPASRIPDVTALAVAADVVLLVSMATIAVPALRRAPALAG